METKKELKDILEEIEQEFDKHINTQLKIMSELEDDVYRYGYGKSLEAYQQGKLFVKDIICNHLNDGWIPADERLPEAGQEVWISVKTDYVRRGMYTKHFGFGVREGFICSDGFVDINAVNAWKLYIIPEPYCPKAKVPERKQE